MGFCIVQNRRALLLTRALGVIVLATMRPIESISLPLISDSSDLSVRHTSQYGRTSCCRMLFSRAPDSSGENMRGVVLFFAHNSRMTWRSGEN